MKRNTRIKLCQENTKARDLRRLLYELDGTESFKIKLLLEKQEKKIEFIKKVSQYLERKQLNK